MKLNHLMLAALVGVFSTSAFADRVITDQLDRQVTIPDHINRAVVLQHQTLNIAVQLDATKQIVGVLSNWKKKLCSPCAGARKYGDAGRFEFR